METGAITEYVDVAQLVLYLFWAFFAGLIFYLRREDKREGYPLVSDRSADVVVQGFPAVPPAKVYSLPAGGTFAAPSGGPDDREVRAEPAHAFPGAPLEPVGDPMLAEVGPGSYAQRHDVPDVTLELEPRIVPMRVATEFWVEPRDPDPRGMDVIGTDGEKGGTVSDIWVDRAEPQIRYLEVEVAGDADLRVLLPITLANVDGRRGCVKVASICGDHFAGVPTTRQPDQVTLLEEDRICAYYAGGHLYAMPSRQEAIL